MVELCSLNPNNSYVVFLARRHTIHPARGNLTPQLQKKEVKKMDALSGLGEIFLHSCEVTPAHPIVEEERIEGLDHYNYSVNVIFLVLVLAQLRRGKVYEIPEPGPQFHDTLVAWILWICQNYPCLDIQLVDDESFYIDILIGTGIDNFFGSLLVDRGHAIPDCL